MTFKCICCQRVQPVGLGRPLPSGSWMCSDLADCAEHITVDGSGGE